MELTAKQMQSNGGKKRWKSKTKKEKSEFMKNIRKNRKTWNKRNKTGIEGKILHLKSSKLDKVITNDVK